MVLQLPLDISLRDSATFHNFVATHNEQLLETLKQFSSGEGESFIYISGQSGTGKTHLLQAVCHAAGEQDLAAAFLPLSRHAEFDPGMLEGWESMSIVCIDDIDAVAGQINWEEALFHLYNRIREQGSRLIVTAVEKPGQLPCVLPDLQSRLSWGLTLTSNELSDEEKLVALQQRAEERGLELPDEVASYLLKRCPRDMSTLIQFLRELDTQSLAAQRRLTIPFVRELL